MNYVCEHGYKCMYFQCGEKDCEHFESEPPKEWDKDTFVDELLDIIILKNFYLDE